MSDKVLNDAPGCTRKIVSFRRRAGTSTLNYLLRMSSCPTCLRALRTYVLYVLICFPCLRAFMLLILTCLSFYVPYVSSFFTCLMCLHFVTCLTYLQFLTCLTCPYLLACLTFFHFYAL